jgi:hypothetical protein
MIDWYERMRKGEYMSDLKDFYAVEYEGEKLGIQLGPKSGRTNYHMVIEAYEIDTWDDGRPFLDLSTKVVCGDSEGVFGPRIRLTLGASSGITATGRSFTVSEEEAAKKFRVTINAIHGGKEKIGFSNPSKYDGTMLEQAGSSVVGDEFYAGISIDSKGYDRVTRVYALAEPPSGFQCDCAAASWTP